MAQLVREVCAGLCCQVLLTKCAQQVFARARVDLQQHPYAEALNTTNSKTAHGDHVDKLTYSF